jgi:hypothetical protein
VASGFFFNFEAASGFFFNFEADLISILSYFEMCSHFFTVTVTVTVWARNNPHLTTTLHAAEMEKKIDFPKDSKGKVPFQYIFKLTFDILQVCDTVFYIAFDSCALLSFM